MSARARGEKSVGANEKVPARERTEATNGAWRWEADDAPNRTRARDSRRGAVPARSIPTDKSVAKP